MTREWVTVFAVGGVIVLLTGLVWIFMAQPTVAMAPILALVLGTSILTALLGYAAGHHRGYVLGKEHGMAERRTHRQE